MDIRKTLAKALFFVSLAGALIWFMVHFGLIDFQALDQAVRQGQEWLLVTFGLALLSFSINLWRYDRVLSLLSVTVRFRNSATATSVSLFAGQWLPGSLAVSEALRMGLMIGAGKLHEKKTENQSHYGEGSLRSKLFLASFIDRSCGLIVFMGTGSLACLYFLLARFSEFSAGDKAVLVFLVGLGFSGSTFLMSVPWLGRHDFFFSFLDKIESKVTAPQRDPLPSKLATRLVVNFVDVARRLLKPLRNSSFSYAGFGRALAISMISNMAVVMTFYTSSLAIGFSIEPLQVAALFPFLTITQLLPIGFGGLGGQQLLAAAVFQIFALDPTRVATVSLLQGATLFVLNSVVGLLFLQGSAQQVKAILSRA